MANEIYLTAMNDYTFYKSIECLTNCIAKKIRKGIEPSLEQLSKCGSMTTLTREVANYLRNEFDEKPTMADRREGAKEIAEYIIESAAYMATKSK